MKSQQGLSLVELLIAFAVSAFLVGGMVQIMLSSKQSYRFQDALNEMQSDARFTFHFLNKEIRHTAYPRSDLLTGFIIADHDILIADGVDTSSDTLVIQHTPSNGKDCTGTAITTPTAINAFYIKDRALVCKGNAGTNEFVIAENVDNFQVLYGVDNSEKKDGSAEIYVPASAVASHGDWSNVVAVRISMLFASADDIQQGPISNSSFHLLNVGPIGPFSDRKIRRVFTTTAIVRNQMP